MEEDNNVEEMLKGVDGILVPGGFGNRGIEGKIMAVKYARENKIPFFGICLGMQCAVIEYARNVCGMEGANSSEFDENTKYPVIDLMPDQVDVEEKAAQCAWASIRARFTRARLPKRLTVQSLFMNATVTAMK